MTRLALEEFPATMFADEFSIAHGDLPAHGDDARAAFEFPAFERAAVRELPRHDAACGDYGETVSIVYSIRAP